MTNIQELLAEKRAELARARLSEDKAAELAYFDERLVGGRAALMESLAEYPGWGLDRLMKLAEWRVKNGLDGDGARNCYGDDCRGCLNIVSERDLRVPWSSRGSDEMQYPTVKANKVGCKLNLAGQPARRARGAVLREGTGSGAYYHVSMLTNTDPRMRRLSLPLVDMNDSRQALRLVEATERLSGRDGLDAIGEDAVCEWAFARRYGLIADNGLPPEILDMQIAELAQRIDDASARLRGICDTLDKAIGLSPAGPSVGAARFDPARREAPSRSSRTWSDFSREKAEPDRRRAAAAARADAREKAAAEKPEADGKGTGKADKKPAELPRSAAGVIAGIGAALERKEKERPARRF